MTGSNYNWSNYNWTTYNSTENYNSAIQNLVLPFESNTLLTKNGALAYFGTTKVGNQTIYNSQTDPDWQFTIGYGYDITARSAAQIQQDLSNAGIWSNLPENQQQAIGNYIPGSLASVQAINASGFSLNSQQALSLFTTILPQYEGEVPYTYGSNYAMSSVNVAAVAA